MAKPGRKFRDRKMVPVYCSQCVAGPDLMRVEVEDGNDVVATMHRINLFDRILEDAGLVDPFEELLH